MAAKTKLLGKAGDGVLVAGETPLAVVRAMKPGNIKKTAVAGGIGGLLGAAVANRMDKGSPEAGFVELARMVLALTDQRLLVFTQSQMTGKAKALHAELPLASVTDVEVGEGKVLGMKIVPLAFGLADGGAFAVEVPFLDKDEAASLGEQLQAIIAAR